MASMDTTIIPAFSPAKRDHAAFSGDGNDLENGTATPSLGEASPTCAFAKLDGQAPAKKAKMTFQERQFQADLKEIKRKEREEEKAKKEADKAQRDVERARRDAEKETERLKKEAEKERKRQIKDAENAEKEEARRKKEEAKQKIEDEKRKKERSQPKLNAFFGTPKVVCKEASPAPSTATDPQVTPTKSKPSDKSEYERTFPPFFVKEHVSLAPYNHFLREHWGSEHLEEELDSYLTGEKTWQHTIPFDAPALFNCPDLKLYVRGKKIASVREIMSGAPGQAGRPIDLTTDSQTSQSRNTRKLLSGVPYKTIKFSQDVRPPYKGTHTRYALSELQKLARNSTKPQLEDLNYEYDSEAEWVDGDEEDAEDLISEMGDDEEGDELDGDLDGFVDDEDDLLAHRRAELPADQQPKSSGLCFEDARRRGLDVHMYGYHMELMLDDLSIKTPIDPFATHYWHTTTPVKTGLMEPPRLPLSSMRGTSPSMNGNISALNILGNAGAQANQKKASTGPKSLISLPEDITAFREIVEGNKISKVGLIEVLHLKMSKATKAQVKASVESWAQYTGAKRDDKRWVLTDACPT